MRITTCIACHAVQQDRIVLNYFAILRINRDCSVLRDNVVSAVNRALCMCQKFSQARAAN